MNMRGKLCRGLVMSCLLALAPAPQVSGLEPIRDREFRDTWPAVGRVNRAGFRVARGCSGTLIAPDLVVTAAHCAEQDLRLGRGYHFVAGWYRGRFVAHRQSQDVRQHPIYALGPEGAHRRYDVAVIRLEDPIPEGLLPPIPLVPRGTAPPRAALLLGYENRAAQMLSGADDCPRLTDGLPGLWVFRCDVNSGASGGAVIVETPTGPGLAAVIVARQGKAGSAVAVPVSDWLRGEWELARLRAAARSGPERPARP